MRPRSAFAWRLAYCGALLVVLVAGAPIVALWVLTHARLRARFGERLLPLAASSEPTVWVHAASVGEVEAAAPLIRALREAGVALRVTTQSATGREHLERRIPGVGARLAPLDLPGLASLCVRRARVRSLILIETELWPNWMRAVQRAGGAVAIASARLSDRSVGRYRPLRGLLAPLLAETEVAAQTRLDAERFVSLGACPARVRVLGDVKLDRLDPARPEADLLAAIGSGPWLVGGSTHPGEELALARAWQKLREESPELRLILAPRHPERASELIRALTAAGMRPALRSKGAASAPIVVLDTLGELAALYAIADLVFVGGSLVPVGGHSLVEPVAAGRVVTHGPHIENQRAQRERLEPLGVLVGVRDADELATALGRLWRDPDRHGPATDARELLLESRGALGRVLAWLGECSVVPCAG